MFRPTVEKQLTSAPLRDGGRGTAMLPSVGVLPREPGAGSRPCFGGSAGTISPTSSNKSSPAMKVPLTVTVGHQTKFVRYLELTCSGD